MTTRPPAPPVPKWEMAAVAGADSACMAAAMRAASRMRWARLAGSWIMVGRSGYDIGPVAHEQGACPGRAARLQFQQCQQYQRVTMDRQFLPIDVWAQRKPRQGTICARF